EPGGHIEDVLGGSGHGLLLAVGRIYSRKTSDGVFGRLHDGEQNGFAVRRPRGDIAVALDLAAAEDGPLNRAVVFRQKHVPLGGVMHLAEKREMRTVRRKSDRAINVLDEDRGGATEDGGAIQ